MRASAGLQTALALGSRAKDTEPEGLAPRRTRHRGSLGSAAQRAARTIDLTNQGCIRHITGTAGHALPADPWRGTDGSAKPADPIPDSLPYAIARLVVGTN